MQNHKKLSISDETRLHLMSEVRDPLSNVLRQHLIVRILQGLQNIHLSADDASLFIKGRAPGLCVKGSASMPLNFRLAGDLDLTVNMNRGYTPRKEADAVERMLDKVARNIKADRYTAHLSSPLYTDTARNLKRTKAFMMNYLVVHVYPEDIGGIKEKLLHLFNFKPSDLAELDHFGPEAIARVVEKRKAAAARMGTTYIPTSEEAQGTGLSEVIAVEVTARDHLNIYAPFAMGEMATTFHNRKAQSPVGALTFSHPDEEAAAKIFAFLTDKLRATHNDFLTRDLVDLYIRTHKKGDSARAWAPFIVSSRNDLIEMLRVSWPAQPAFHGGETFFKKIDPDLGHNVKQVRNGLLQLQKEGTLGESVFGEPITEENARHYAQELLQQAWGICAEAFGVKREGTKRNPIYELHPPEKVAAYWDLCKEIPKKTANKPRSEYIRSTRVDKIIAQLETAIHAMQETPPAPKDTAMASTGALNAHLAADHTAQWSGLKR